MRHNTFTAIAPLLAATAVAAFGAPDEPVQLPQFFVPGDRIGAVAVAVPRGDLRPPEPNLGQELLAIPGVASHARAADAMEPLIRGLAFDRVATTVDGLPLLNGSPERTNSPVVILGPAAVTGIRVIKALPSVTLGPATTGGRIALSTDDGPAAGPSQRCSGVLSTMYNGSRDGFTTRGRLVEKAGAYDSTVTFFRNDLGDYAAPDGRQVAARLDDYGASVAAGWHSDTHRFRADFLQRRQRRQEAVSLPLDGKNTDSQVFTANDRWSFGSGALEAIEERAGYAYTDPYITSEDRKAPSLIFAQGTARSLGAGATTRWRLAENDTLAAGVDFARQERRAIRTTAAGLDYIWPDAVYEDTGLFAEWTRRLAPEWKLRLGTRADDVHSNARDADRPALGKPIRDQYVAYNGPGAALVARTDHTGAANALLDWNRHDTWSSFIGGGLTIQPAEVMERYRAFLNALGGDGHGGNAVELGNPALRPERNAALEAGGTWRQALVEVEATGFYYHIDDFILRAPIGTTQPPLAKMVVFGYRNVDVAMSGAEVGATLKPGDAWRIPLTFAVANGHRRDTGIGLAEIPPWEATFAVRYHAADVGLPMAIEAGGRMVGAKDNPAPLDNPLFGNVGGFTVWHARAGVPLGRYVRIEVGIENAFDHRYTEYLTPPVAPFAPASGNLLPGDRIPAPGRAVWSSVTVAW